MTTKKKVKPTLTPGSHARVYRDGEGEPVGVYEVPRDGSPLEVRDLAPGSYEARDECGLSYRFLVEPGAEVAVLKGRQATKKDLAPDSRAVPGEAGTSLVQETGPERVLEPGSEEAQAVREAVAGLPVEEQRMHGHPVPQDE